MPAIQRLNNISALEKEELEKFLDRKFNQILQEFDAIWDTYKNQGDSCPEDEDELKIMWGSEATMVQALFRIFEGSSSPDNEEHIKRRKAIYEKCFMYLNDQSAIKTAPKTSQGIFTQLKVMTGRIQAQTLVKCAELYLARLRKSEMNTMLWHQMFAKIVLNLSVRKKEYANYDEFKRPCTEVSQRLVEDLEKLNWAPGANVVGVAAVFEEICTEIDKTIVTDAHEKLRDQLEHVDLKLLPELLGKLINIARCLPQRDCILWKALTFCYQKFYQEERQPNDRATQNDREELFVHPGSEDENEIIHSVICQSVVKMVIEASIIDYLVLKEYIKIFKAFQSDPHEFLNEFNILIALAVASQGQFLDPMISFLKGIFRRFYHENKECSKSGWFRDMVEGDSVSSETVRLRALDLDKIIMGVVKKVESKDLFDVARSAVKFGFAMMDLLPNLSKSSHLMSRSPDFLTANEACCRVGQILVVEIFKLRSHQVRIRGEIVDQLFRKIQQRYLSNACHYIEVLARCIHAGPVVLIERKTVIESVIEMLAVFKKQTAVQLLRSLIPLLKINLELRTRLSYNLAQNLNHCGDHRRQVACTGFMLALKYYKVAGSLPWSQTQSTMQSSIVQQSQSNFSQKLDPNTSQELCTELLRFLRHQLTSSDPDVKSAIYEGAYGVILRNSNLMGIMAELLLSNFRRYYEWDLNRKTVLKLDNCVRIIKGEAEGGESKAICIEPLGELIMAMQLCDILAREREKDAEIGLNYMGGDDPSDCAPMLLPECITALRGNLEELTKRLLKSELNDFGLGENQKYDKDDSLGQQNRIKATLLYGVLEAITEYIYMKEESKNGDFCEKLLKLQNLIQGIHERLVRPPSSKKKEPKKKKACGKKRKSDEPDADLNENGDETQEGKDHGIDQKDTEEETNPTKLRAPVVPRHMISVKCAARIIQDLFLGSNDEAVIARNLSRDEDFVYFLVYLLKEKVTEFAQTGYPDPFTVDDFKGAYQNFVNFGRGLVKKLDEHATSIAAISVENFEETNDHDGYFDGRLAYISAEALYILIKAISERFPTKFPDFLSKTFGKEERDEDMEANEKPQSLEDICIKALEVFENMILKCVSSNDEVRMRKETHFYFSSMQIIANHMHKSPIDISNHCIDWCCDLMTRPIQDPHLVKAIWNLLMVFCTHKPKSESSEKERDLINLLRLAVLDIHKCWGDIDDEVTLEEGRKFYAINKKTVNLVSPLVLSSCEAALKEIKWIFDRMISLSNNKLYDGELGDIEKRRKHVKDILFRFGSLLAAYGEVIQTKVPERGLAIKVVWSSLKLIYTIAINITKMFDSKWGKKGWYQDIPIIYMKVLKILNETITPKSSKFFCHIQNEIKPVKKANKDSAEGSLPVYNENIYNMTKSIPDIIELIEKFDGALIKLERKSKAGVLRYHHLMPNRDFKLSKKAFRLKEPKTLAQNNAGE